MVRFNDIMDNKSEYDTRAFKSYKKHKQYRSKVMEKTGNIPANAHIEQKYFSCISCGKINLIEDIVKEDSENRTMRTRYQTWKMFKDIANEVGGSLENGLLYLMSLHEPDGKLPRKMDDNAVGIAGFGGGEGEEKK